MAWTRGHNLSMVCHDLHVLVVGVGGWSVVCILTKSKCSQSNNSNLNFVLMKANATWPKRRFKLFLLLF